MSNRVHYWLCLAFFAVLLLEAAMLVRPLKWSGLLAILLAYAGGIGIQWASRALEKERTRDDA
jgi:protein-S-isoprenylcysteine O-methyltransferase Ste14